MDNQIPIVAYSERYTYDPITGEGGILRKEWRLRLLGDETPGEPSVSYETIQKHFRRIGEWVQEVRYIRRGVDEGWQLFDTGDDFDDLLVSIDSGAIPVHPRLLELHGEWEAAQAKRERLAEAERQERAKQEEAAAKCRRHIWAWTKFKENPRQAELWNAWCKHVTYVRDNEGLQDALMAIPEFMVTGEAVYAAESQPAIAKAMRTHLDRWGVEPKLGS